MNPTVDEILITDDNREAFELVLGITQNKEMPVNAYIYGEHGSGKTYVFQTRVLDKDLLSNKHVAFSHAAELMTAIQFDAGDRILEKVGSVDVLLLDSFDLFFNDVSSGPLLCKLLLKERQSQGLSTIIAGEKPLSSYDLSLLDGAMDSFKEYRVAPLQRTDYLELAQKIQSVYVSDKSDATMLSHEALEYLALEFADTPKEIKTALHFLLTVADFPSGTVIDVEMAKDTLGR